MIADSKLEEKISATSFFSSYRVYLFVAMRSFDVEKYHKLDILRKASKVKNVNVTFIRPHIHKITAFVD